MNLHGAVFVIILVYVRYEGICARRACIVLSSSATGRPGFVTLVHTVALPLAIWRWPAETSTVENDVLRKAVILVYTSSI